MRARRAFLIALVGGLLLSMGNMAPPYAPCVGKAEGDRCTGYGCSGGGTCRVVENCTDDPSTNANECLFCERGA